jgi:hypothetical protein
MGWYESYVGKPWEAVPRPPESYNCGELVRAVLLERRGIDLGEICEDPTDLVGRIKCFDSRLFGLRELGPGEARREYDCVFMAKSRYDDHCGIAVNTLDGLMILHCLQTSGVVMETPLETMTYGFRRLNWYRHKGL